MTSRTTTPLQTTSLTQMGLPSDVRRSQFLELPTEIKRHVFQYVAPSGRALRFTTRDPEAPEVEDPVSDFFNRLPRPQAYPYQVLERRAERQEGDSQTLLTLFLIHPTLTSILLEFVCRDNLFSFPDVFTIQSFIDQKIGSLCRLHMTDMAIDACGIPVSSSGMTSQRFKFTNEPDLRIPEVIKLFPRLEFLTLGGIGLGVRLSMDCLGDHDEFEQRMRFSSSTWSVEQIKLIARIVGADASSDSKYSPLRGGRIFHNIIVRPEYTQMSCGALQYLSTRILSKNHRYLIQPVDVRSPYEVRTPSERRNVREVELVDIGEAMKKAEEHDDLDGRRLRFEQAQRYLEKCYCFESKGKIT